MIWTSDLSLGASELLLLAGLLGGFARVVETFVRFVSPADLSLLAELLLLGASVVGAFDWVLQVAAVLQLLLLVEVVALLLGIQTDS